MNEPRKSLAELEWELPALTRHAYETYTIAFTYGDPDLLTMQQLHAYLRRIYGAKTHDELLAHLEARMRAVLPK